MSDLIERQAAIDALDCINGAEEVLRALPPAKPEHDAKFWRKRAGEYSDICLALTAEMTKGIKFNSIRIDENGITFGEEQPERKTGHWILYDKRFPWSKDYKCSECGNYINISDINAGRGSANFCPNCGADMRGERDGKTT